VTSTTKMADQDLTDQISRLLEHFKIRPTYITLNTVYMVLKNHGYRNIPRIHFSETSQNVVDAGAVREYCKSIETLVKLGPIPEDPKKKNSSKEVHMFQESSMLPQNVYVSEKRDEEKLEDNYVEDGVSSVSGSETSVNSEAEDQEEGYVIYEDDDSDQFSV